MLLAWIELADEQPGPRALEQVEAGDGVAISSAGMPSPTAGMLWRVTAPSLTSTVLAPPPFADLGAAPLNRSVTDCFTGSPALSV
jgi:hypothetical protein